MSEPLAIHWFRLDLRVSDNPSLHHLHKMGTPIIPIYILDPDDAIGGASKWWLHHSLKALAGELEKKGSQLILLKGRPCEVIPRLVKDTGANLVSWNRCCEPAALKLEQRLSNLLEEQGCSPASFQANLLFEPWEIKNKAGKPFQVFTPFYKHCLQLDAPRDPVPSPRKLKGPSAFPAGCELDELKLYPVPDWAGGLNDTFQPGEKAAYRKLDQFLDQAVHAYPDQRDIPSAPGTSGLSPHLHFGEISPNQVWYRAQERISEGGRGSVRGTESWLRQLVWREFAFHLLYHFPHTPDQPLRQEFAAFPWEDDDAGLVAWQKGLTGIPMVDAGMRELWHTGWMHNRVRMIAASYLVKHQLIPWQRGAEWFWDTLVDADLANNTLGWQWTAGCGADAAPYFRVFNPVTQGKKFDPGGQYIRQWIPELARLPDSIIHEPWEAEPLELAEAGITLGKTYPYPVVGVREGRERALEAYEHFKHAVTG